MKELYTTPELELIGLAADENLASNSTIDYDSLLNNPATGDAVKPSDNDIDVPLFNIGL